MSNLDIGWKTFSHELMTLRTVSDEDSYVDEFLERNKELLEKLQHPKLLGCQTRFGLSGSTSNGPSESNLCDVYKYNTNIMRLVLETNEVEDERAEFVYDVADGRYPKLGGVLSWENYCFVHSQNANSHFAKKECLQNWIRDHSNLVCGFWDLILK